MAIHWQAVIPGSSFSYLFETPCGYLHLQGQGCVLTRLSWFLDPGGCGDPKVSPDPLFAETDQGEFSDVETLGRRVPETLETIRCQLQQYFVDPYIHFQCSLVLQGTPFYRRVWQALLGIPVGQVRTYGELATSLGTSPRAVASACRANPYPVIVPCHRVVAKSGLGGYCGQAYGPMTAIKRWLLCHEGRGEMLACP